MNWQTILASGVIAACVTGLLSLINSILGQKNDNKMKYITAERKEWRKQIRNVCLMFDDEMAKHSINKILTNVKVNINTYGVNKKEVFDCTLEEYTDFYIKDGHIWNQINIIEAKNVDEKEKSESIKKLKIYLCKLIKFDWDRSKYEVVGNKQTFYSFLLFLFAELIMTVFSMNYCLFVLNMPTNGGKNQFYILFKVFSYALLFAIPFFISNLSKIRLDNIKPTKKAIYSACGLSILLVVIVIAIISKFCEIEEYANTIGWVILPLSIQLISILVNWSAQFRDFAAEKKYVLDLIKFDNKKIKEDYNKFDKLYIKVENDFKFLLAKIKSVLNFLSKKKIK